MDEKIAKEQILRALEHLGIDAHAEHFKTEMYHLITLFEQKKTIAEALETVVESNLLPQLRPALYYVALHSLIIAATRLQAITSEQARELDGFLVNSVNGLANTIHRQSAAHD